MVRQPTNTGTEATAAAIDAVLNPARTASRVEILELRNLCSLGAATMIEETLLVAQASRRSEGMPILVGCRTIPWAKRNLNYTAQALLISAAAVAGFFIAADKTILESARGNTIGKHDKHA